jgi:hypothetical protein
MWSWRGGVWWGLGLIAGAVPVRGRSCSGEGGDHRFKSRRPHRNDWTGRAGTVAARPPTADPGEGIRAESIRDGIPDRCPGCLGPAPTPGSLNAPAVRPQPRPARAIQFNPTPIGDSAMRLEIAPCVAWSTRVGGGACGLWEDDAAEDIPARPGRSGERTMTHAVRVRIAPEISGDKCRQMRRCMAPGRRVPAEGCAGQVHRVIPARGT